MKKEVGVSIVLAFLFWVSCANAVIWTSGDYQIGNGEVYDEIKIYNDVTVEIFNGSQIQWLETYDETMVTMYGGQLGTLNIATSNSINFLKGGIIECINTVGAGTFSSVHIYGQHFNFEQETFGYTLTGQWLNDAPFSIYLRNYHLTIDPVILHEIPEPMTVLFLSFGYFLIKKRS